MPGPPWQITAGPSARTPNSMTKSWYWTWNGHTGNPHTSGRYGPVGSSTPSLVPSSCECNAEPQLVLDETPQQQGVPLVVLKQHLELEALAVALALVLESLGTW